jgi:hypothetical protein
MAVFKQDGINKKTIVSKHLMKPNFFQGHRVKKAVLIQFRRERERHRRFSTKIVTTIIEFALSMNVSRAKRDRRYKYSYGYKIALVQTRWKAGIK